MLFYIKNTSNSSYDLGALGSYSYSSKVDTLIDCELKMDNGEKEYSSLLIDNGGLYGIMSSGRIHSQETVTYYFAFIVEKGQSAYYQNGEILIAFAENFKEQPNYKHSNCEYLYKINLELGKTTFEKANWNRVRQEWHTNLGKN